MSNHVENLPANIPDLPAEGTAEYRELTNGIIAEFRAAGGHVGGILEGLPLILLTTTGVKSGLPRTTPVAYHLDGDRLILVAAKAGDTPRHPDWFLNLRANPDVTVELGRELFPARATILTGKERQQLFDLIRAGMPADFSGYLDKTSVEIPVIAIEREP
jgi:deazaflavin-dependent oxidoreductase (nitroreductase family)